MAISVVGSGSAAATSVAIPAHAVGDLIIVAARGTAAAPSVPAAAGTVPAWATLQTGLANAIGLTVVAFVATGTTTTTGVFTNATHIAVTVLRTSLLSTRRLEALAARSSVGNGNNTQTIIYPALVFNKLDGTSMGVRIGTRTVAITAVGTAPAGWTAQVAQPAGAAALMSLHTRLAITVSPTADTVTTTSSNAAYRAVTIEVQEVPTSQSVAVSGKTSSQAFGAPNVTTTYPAQSLDVVGLPPGSANVFLAAEFLSGQALVGWTSGSAQFGTVTAGIVTGVDLPVNGVSSAAAFGTHVAKSAIARVAPGIPTGQSFGVFVIKAAITRAIAGITSAQAFGTLTLSVVRTVNGVSSAQGFGALVAVPGVASRSVTGIASAQAFGQIQLAGENTRVMTGLGSAQAFGVPVPKATFLRTVSGITSAQSFGVPTRTTAITIPVAGKTSAASFGVPVPKSGRIVSVLGIGSAASFGSLTPRVKQIVAPGGLGSAQAFGPSLRIDQRVPVQGLRSLQDTFDPNLAGEYLAGQALVGYEAGFVAPFGRPTIYAIYRRSVLGIGSAAAFGTSKVSQAAHPLGVGSAQSFGVLTIITGPVWVLVLGLGSAQAFGAVEAYVVYNRPLDCRDEDLSPLLALDLDLEAAACLDLDLVPLEV